MILVKLQAETCNFTKSITLPWVFFTFFQIVQMVPNRAKHHINVQPILSVTFHEVLGKSSVSRKKLLKNCYWCRSVIFIVSPVFIAAMNTSVMGEMSRPYTTVKTTHKINLQVTVHKDRGNEDWAFTSVILKYQILPRQVHFI